MKRKEQFLFFLFALCLKGKVGHGGAAASRSKVQTPKTQRKLHTLSLSLSLSRKSSQTDILPIPMATSPPRSPNSGDPPEAANRALAAREELARGWSSLAARLPSLSNSIVLAAVSGVLRSLFVGRRRRRHRRRPALPLPIYDDAGSSAR